MTSRERWILYPLLIMALAVALRDKVALRTVPLRADRIICNRLEAVDAKCVQLRVAGRGGRDAIRLGAVSGAGQMEMYGRAGEEELILPAGDRVERKSPAKAPSVCEQPDPENWLDRLGRYWSMLDEWIEAEPPPGRPAAQPDKAPPPDTDA